MQRIALNTMQAHTYRRRHALLAVIASCLPATLSAQSAWPTEDPGLSIITPLTPSRELAAH